MAHPVQTSQLQKILLQVLAHLNKTQEYQLQFAPFYV